MNSQGTYDELVNRYRTLTTGRCVLLLVLLIHFWLVAHARPRYSPPPDRPVFPLTPYSLKGTVMLYEKRSLDQVEIHAGLHEQENMSLRTLVGLIFDGSSSMARHFDALPAAWESMVAQLADESETRQQVLLACCAFSDRIDFFDYGPVDFYQKRPLQLHRGGGTHLARAVQTTIQQTLALRAQLAAEGIPARRSLCVVVTDGAATDSGLIPQAIFDIRRAQQQGEIEFVPIAPAEEDVPRLEQIFNVEPILLANLDCKTLFQGITHSLLQYTHSRIGATPSARTLIAENLRDVDTPSLNDPQPQPRPPAPTS